MDALQTSRRDAFAALIFRAFLIINFFSSPPFRANNAREKDGAPAAVSN
jgi:hypothetical protein